MVLGIIIPAYPSWGVETKKLARASGVGSQFHFSFHARDKARVSVYIAFGEGLNCVKRHGVQLVGICCGFGFRLRHYNNATWNWRVQSWWLWSQRKQHFHKYTFTEQKTTVHAMLLVWTSNKGSRYLSLSGIFRKLAVLMMMMMMTFSGFGSDIPQRARIISGIRNQSQDAQHWEHKALWNCTGTSLVISI